MSLFNFNRLRALSIIVFIVGTVTAGLGYSLNWSMQSTSGLGFTITSKETFTPSDGGTPLLGITKVRYQKSDGTWKEVRTYHNPDGTVKEINTAFAQIGRGVFQVDEKNRTLTFISFKRVKQLDSTTYDPRKDPRFIREDSVFGYQTQVLRFPEDDGSGYTEIHLAPALQNFPIKQVHVSSKGTAVEEPVKIEVGNPPESVFKSLPDWPVKYDDFKDKIQATEDAGNHEMAEQMRHELQQLVLQEPT